MTTNEYDVLVVGGGAAGLSGALVLARARRHVLVVDSGSPRNAPAAQMHGFLSRDGLPPSDLLAAGRAEVAAYGGHLVTGTVHSVSTEPGADGPAFAARLGDGAQVRARRLLITTGMHDELPDVPGLRERWARDVLHCPYCHGYEVRDRRLGVLWNGPATVAYAQIVRQWSTDVVLFAPAGCLTGSQRIELDARGIEVVDGEVSGVALAADAVAGVLVDGGRIVSREVLFVPPRFVPHSELLGQLGCDLDADGWVVTAPHGETSVPGVRVAGNVADPRAQVITAAGQGSAAAIALNADLVEQDVRRAVRTLDNPSDTNPPN